MIKFNKKVINNHIFRFIKKILITNGRIKEISTSKIINKIAIKKNRIEKGIFAGLKKLNPHSNGVDFSRQFFLFFETVVKIMINNCVIKNKDKTEFKIDNIKSLKLLDPLQNSVLLLGLT